MTRNLVFVFLAVAITPASAQSIRSAEQPPSSIPQGPPGTVTVETFLGDIGTPSRRAGGGTNPLLINQRDLFTADSYPQLAWERGVTGTVKVEVEVDPSGLATDCKTVVPTPPAELGGPTCALFLAQARFVPAADRKGKPVKAVYRRTVRWVLPAIPPIPVTNGTGSITFSFDSKGGRASCEAERPAWDKAQPEEPDPCESMGQTAQFLALTSPRTDWLAWELRMETHFIPGSDPFWKALGAGPDQQLLGRFAVQLTIGPDGIVRKCEKAGSEIVHPMMVEMDACPQTRRMRFEPSTEAERKLQLVSVLYFRRKEPTLRT